MTWNSNKQSKSTVFSIATAAILLVATENLSAQEWTEHSKVVASDRLTGAWFGGSAAVDGDYAIIGAFQDNYDHGAAYIFHFDGTTWNATQKLVDPDPIFHEWFGSSVAISGNYAIVGAPLENIGLTGLDSLNDGGTAYIYELSGGTWTQMQKIVSSDRREFDQFGQDVAIYGNRAVVATQFQDYDENNSNLQQTAGAAYIFDLIDGTWVETQKIVASDRTLEDRFGSSVSMTDGLIAIGAGSDSHNENGVNHLLMAGSAYIFEYSDDQWSESQKVVASDRKTQAQFGRSVAINGNLLLVGALGETHDEFGNDPLVLAGAAYMYQNISGSWNEVQKIVSPDRSMDDVFGMSLALVDDYALISAAYEDDDSSGTAYIHDAGAAYVYEVDNSNLSNPLKIFASDRAENCDVGAAVAMSDNHIILGSYGNDVDVNGEAFFANAGAAYFFQLTSPDGIGDFQSIPSLGVYPNPATEHVVIDSDQAIDEVAIYSSLGRLVKKETTGNFSVSNLLPGVYHLKMISDNQVFQGRFVKQ